MASPETGQPDLSELAKTNLEVARNIAELTENVIKMTERLARVETRMVKIAMHLGLDASGKPR